MVAPIDSRAQLVANDETITLTMNFRTIALAERELPGVVTDFAGAADNLSEPAVLVWAFAQPAHPTLTLDQALALVLRHSRPTLTALTDLFRRASSDEEGAAADAAPGEAKAA